MATPQIDRPLLALDTSGTTTRVALCSRDGRSLAAAERAAERHSSNLLALCDEVFRATGVAPRDLAAIACGAGPGSFTGLRVGLAAAKGLALPWDTPLVLVSSLAALARDLWAAVAGNAAVPATAVPCIDAGKGEVHARVFETDRAASGAAVRMPPEMLLANLAGPPGRGKIVLGGTGVDRHRDIFQRGGADTVLVEPSPGPTATAIAHLGWRRLERGERDDLASATPLYGRPPDITRPRGPRA